MRITFKFIKLIVFISVLSLWGNSYGIEAYKIPFQSISPETEALALKIPTGSALPSGARSQGPKEKKRIPLEVLQKARELLREGGKEESQGEGAQKEEVPLEGPPLLKGKGPASPKELREYGREKEEEVPVFTKFEEGALGPLEAERRPPEGKGREAEEDSAFEKYVKGKFSDVLDRSIKQFGYDLFSKPLKAPFLPVQEIPIDPSYIIGPGDEIKLHIWGKIMGDYTLEVDKEGNIYIPSVGEVRVAGLKFRELRSRLKKEIGKYYTGFSLSVTLGRLRSIRIFVVGKVRHPGTYEVPNLSTIIHALFAAQGPSKTGSMRDIQLIRNGQTISHFDLYDFILKGDKGKDLQLRAGDVIFIPFCGPLVAVIGAVKTPAIYELKEEKRLLDVIQMAGGITAVGYTHRVQVERVYENRARMVLDKNLEQLTEEDNILLKDGDIIKIFPISSVIVNSVRLTGNVIRPGIYAWKEGLRVSDVIKSLEDLKPESILDYAMIIRKVPPDFHEKLIYFNLLKAIEKDPNNDILLKARDILHVFSKAEFKIEEFVEIRGPLYRPGRYPFREGMKLSDLLKLAGGLRPVEILDYGVIHRLVPPDFHGELIFFDLKDYREKGEELKVSLEPGDSVHIYSKAEFKIVEKVRVSGPLYKPGEFIFMKNMKVADLVKLAGGPRPFASKDAELTRVRVTQEGPVTERIYIDLFKALEDDPEHNIPLQENDYLFVRSVPEWQLYRLVTITGEVKYPGTYTVKKGERLSSLIERAGGFTEKAYLKGTIFTRESIRELQERNLEKMIQRLETEMAVLDVQTASASFMPQEKEELTLISRRVQLRRELLARLRQIKPTGRLVLKMAPLKLLRGTPSDVELEDGDQIYIPERMQSIHVLGAVYNPSAFLYEPGRSVNYYIERAGGLTPYAKRSRIYVVKIDGSTVSPSKLYSLVVWNPETYRLELNDFSYRELDPGDTIIVPEDLERIPFFKGLRDITSIIYQIAITAGVLITLF